MESKLTWREIDIRFVGPYTSLFVPDLVVLFL